MAQAAISEKLNSEISHIRKEVGILRSLVISILAKDKEGEYRSNFVRRLLKVAQEKPVHEFVGSASFLKQVKKGMIKIVYSAGFLKSVQKLPQKIQEQLAELLVLLQGNPYHPRLHGKHLSGELGGFLSFRITRDWRVIFRFLDPDTIQLIRAAHRKDIYR